MLLNYVGTSIGGNTGRIQGHSLAKKRVILGLQRLDLEKKGVYCFYTNGCWAHANSFAWCSGLPFVDGSKTGILAYAHDPHGCFETHLAHGPPVKSPPQPMRAYLKRVMQRLARRMKKVVPVHIPILQNTLLEGRVALITGGTSGIGRAIAEAFVGSGATVIVASRTQSRIDETCEALRAIRQTTASAAVHGIVLDVADTESHAGAIDAVLAKLNGMAIDILVNNAGVLRGGQFGAVTLLQFEEAFQTNVRGTYFLTQLLARHMVERKVAGNVLNIASSSSLRPAITPYTLSKWALRGMTLGLAKTLIPYDIVVNGLAPGPTATPMLVADGYDGIELPSSPVGRYATAEEIAQMAVVLVSGLGRMIVGDTVYMTGGAGTVTVDDIAYKFRAR